MTSTNPGDETPALSTRKPRRMAREAQAQLPTVDMNTIEQAKADKIPSKLDRVEELLLAPAGASVAELIAATGWQQHSVRGAMAGALKKRGLTISSDKIDGVRRYRAEQPA
jgi:hypothetical protein